MSNSIMAKEETRRAYRKARREAFLRQFLTTFNRQSNALLMYEEVRKTTRAGTPIYRGIQSVPLDQILGSVDRHDDFDRAFWPSQTFTEHRWKSVGEARYVGIELPPIHLYKIGEVYFVMDGNHRVSVARSRGQDFIDAEVYEAQSRVPVTSDLTVGDLSIINERLEFLERTHIDQIRPDVDIEITTPGGYYRLLEHITVHQYLQGLEWKREFSMGEAVAQWLDQVYCPTVKVIREAEILDDFPGHTEADLYLWLNEHLYYLKQQYGDDIDESSAAKHFADHFTERPLKRTIHWLMHHVLPGRSSVGTDDIEG